jgi:hypothetical protein
LIYGAENENHIKEKISRHAGQKSDKSETQTRPRRPWRRCTKSGQEDFRTARALENPTKKTPVKKQGALHVDSLGQRI